MSDNINSRNTEPEDGSSASPTEMDFASFLGGKSDINKSAGGNASSVEKDAEDIKELFEDIMSFTPSQDGEGLPPEITELSEPGMPSPFAPAGDNASAQASPEESEVVFNPEPPALPEDDFNATLAGALSELDSLLDDIYVDAPAAKTEKPAMQDISSVSRDEDVAPSESFGVVSPDKLDELKPTGTEKQTDAAFSQKENYFLGRVPATAPDAAEPSPFVASQGTPTQSKRPSLQSAGNEKGQKKTSAVFPAKGDSTGEIIRKLVLMVSIITIVVSSGILVNSYFIEPYRFNVQADKAVGDLLNVDDSGNVQAEDLSAVSANNPKVVYPEGLLKKYYKLYAANKDLAGWIKIPALQINLPLAQGDDNQYYLKRDVYGKRTKYGVPFLDYRNTLRVLNRNTIVYGHNMEYDDLIFGMLENYRTVDGFKSAPVIECNTIYNDYSWLVYAVFVTNGAKKDDNGYVFNYNFTELDNYTFLEYIQQVDQRKLYTTGVDILSTDKILTLSTCSYDFNGARLVVIARLLRDGESLHVSTANTAVNPNPRYPQAWYDAQNKSNPYANSEKWVAYADTTN